MRESEKFERELTCSSGERIVIRSLGVEDLDDFREAFNEEELVMEDMFLDTMLSNPEYGLRMVVALLGDRVIGRARITLNQCDVAPQYQGKVGFIKDVLVAETFRSKQIGTALVQFAEEVIRVENKEFSGLRVVSNHVRPLRWYLRSGYGDMFMDLPDALDLYKELGATFVPKSEEGVEFEFNQTLAQAQKFSEEQGMSDSYSWQ